VKADMNMLLGIAFGPRCYARFWLWIGLGFHQDITTFDAKIEDNN